MYMKKKQKKVNKQLSVYRGGERKLMKLKKTGCDRNKTFQCLNLLNISLQTT